MDTVQHTRLIKSVTTFLFYAAILTTDFWFLNKAPDLMQG